MSQYSTAVHSIQTKPSSISHKWLLTDIFLETRLSADWGYTFQCRTPSLTKTGQRFVLHVILHTVHRHHVNISWKLRQHFHLGQVYFCAKMNHCCTTHSCSINHQQATLSWVGFNAPLTYYRSFWRNSLQPISWLLQNFTQNNRARYVEGETRYPYTAMQVASDRKVGKRFTKTQLTAAHAV